MDKPKEEYAMTTKELLEKYYDIEMNNVFCYSATYLMDSPKKGYEREWREACESAGILKELIEECE